MCSQLDLWGHISEEQSNWSRLKLFPQPWEMLSTLKKSCHRPSTLAIWIIFLRWRQNTVPQFLSCKRERYGILLPPPRTLPQQREDAYYPKLLQSSQEGHEKQIILHLELDYNLHKAWSHRLEWVAVNFTGSVPGVPWTKQKPSMKYSVRTRYRVYTADSNADTKEFWNFAGSECFSETLNYFNISNI